MLILTHAWTETSLTYSLLKEAYSCCFIHLGYNERGFFPLHPRTLDNSYLTEKRDVHFSLELMYEQCVTSAGCKKMYMKPFHSVGYISEVQIKKRSKSF